MGESSFCNLLRGGRLQSYVTLKMDPEVPYRFGPDYTYVEIPIREFYLPSEEKIVTEGKRGQRIRIIPACTIHPKGNGTHVEVAPNHALSEYGDVQASYYVNYGDPECSPGFYITLRKDLPKREELGYAIRLYMRV